MMGCLKENEAPTRVFISKYYTPFQIFPDHVLPHYYSGGGYIMDRVAHGNEANCKLFGLAITFLILSE